MTMTSRVCLPAFNSRTLRIGLAAGLAGFGSMAMASTDYGPAVWRPACSSEQYTSGNGHKFLVVHDMEGYYAYNVTSGLVACGGSSVSVHYAVNGKKDASSDMAAGEVTQMVREANYAWHARCWNTYSAGCEHEGFASNPAWFTPELYNASASLFRHMADHYGIPKDRNHIVGHNADSSSAWVSWANANLGINASCNTHSDPGAYWDWSGYMDLINPPNPPYLFANDTQGWTAGHSIAGLNWNGTSWPGIIYGDQNGSDAYFYSPSCSYTGPGKGVINVSLYPQNGTSATHDMQVFYKTTADNTWTAAKSSPVVNYTVQNAWIRLNMDLDNASYVGQTINQLRLDFDQASVGTRWIVNHVVSQSSFDWSFASSEMHWTAGARVSPITWTDCCGWPGIIYVDQTGDDGYIYSSSYYFDNAGPYNFLGGANDKIHVRVYPQNGTTASHDMQVFWKLSSDDTWTASKSSPIVNYTAQNTWADVILDVGSNPLWCGGNNASGGVTEIRLDFDNTNHSTRFIIDYVRFEHN